jgi:multidrug transporter EmrE-like cation transporter
MNILDTLVVLISVFLSVSAQISLKKAATLSSLDTNSAISFLVKVGASPFTWIGLLLFGSSLALWIMILAKLPVSKAYPFVTIGIVMTSAAGIAFLDYP